MRRQSIRKIVLDLLKLRRERIRIAKEITVGAIGLYALAFVHWQIDTPKPLFVFVATCLVAYAIVLYRRDLEILRPRRRTEK